MKIKDSFYILSIFSLCTIVLNSHSSTEPSTLKSSNSTQKCTLTPLIQASMRSEIEKEITTYFEENYPHIKDESVQDILDYIKDSLLADPLFHENPISFLNQWDREESFGISVVFPKTYARVFLESILKKGTLINWARKAHSAQFQSKRNSHLSSLWYESKRDLLIDKIQRFLENETSSEEKEVTESNPSRARSLAILDFLSQFYDFDQRKILEISSPDEDSEEFDETIRNNAQLLLNWLSQARLQNYFFDLLREIKKYRELS